jgi:hypothetical protein
MKKLKRKKYLRVSRKTVKRIKRKSNIFVIAAMLAITVLAYVGFMGLADNILTRSSQYQSASSGELASIGIGQVLNVSWLYILAAIIVAIVILLYLKHKTR